MIIKDKVIVVTGAAQGLGEAIAHHLANLGASIALVDINEPQLEQATQRHLEKGHKVTSFLTNVADEASVITTFAKINQQFGRIDGLVNNAGIIRDGLLVREKNHHVVDSMSLEDWQQVINVNLTGVFLCGREATKLMVGQQSEGVIVNMSSISKEGNIGQSNYSAAKAGVAAMTTTWAKELARYQIRCAAVAPGFIATDMTESIKPEMLEKIRRDIPLKNLGKPSHIAQTIQFIFENDYISGRVIEVDGALRI